MAQKRTGRRIRLTRRVVTLADEIAQAEQVQQAKPKQQPKRQQRTTNWDSPKLRREKMQPNYVSAEDVYDVNNDGINHWDWN